MLIHKKGCKSFSSRENMEVNILKEYAFLMLYNKYKYYNYYASQSKKNFFCEINPFNKHRTENCKKEFIGINPIKNNSYTETIIF